MSAANGLPADGVGQSLASDDNEGRQAPNANDVVEGNGAAGDGLSSDASRAMGGEKTEEKGEETAARKRRRHWLPHTIRRLAELLALGFVVEYLVVPQISGTHQAIHVLASVNPFLPLAGLVLEALCLVAYFQLTRSLVPKGSDPGFATTSRIQLSTLGLGHCVPGGNAVAYSLGYRLLMKAGVGGADTGFTLSTLGLGSAVVLNAIFIAALVASLPLYGFHPVYLSVALVGLLLMGLVVGLVVLLTKGDQRATRLLRALGTRLPYLRPETLPMLFSQLVSRVRELSRDRRRMWVALAYAVANWLLDAASLFVFVGAFGHWMEPVGLLVAYGVGTIAAALPLTPGGLGVVEAGVTSVLVALGTPRGIAIWGVLGWRLVNFWLPIPVGGLAYLSILVHPPAESQAGLTARRALWRERWRRAAEFFATGKTTEVLTELEEEMDEDLKREVGASG